MILRIDKGGHKLSRRDSFKCCHKGVGKKLCGCVLAIPLSQKLGSKKSTYVA